MQPVMVEQHLHRLFELGHIGTMDVAVVEAENETYKKKKYVANSDTIKSLFTVAKGKRIFVLFTGGELKCLIGGDQIELNGTNNGHGTGLCFALNHLPKNQPLRRIDTSFRAVDKIYADMSS